jgi:hypothetical protein
MPPWLHDVLANRDVIALNQEDRASRPVSPPHAPTGLRVWVSGPRGRAVDTIAIFNVADAPLTIDVPWSALGLVDGAFAACSLWSRAPLPTSTQAGLTIAPHGVVALRVSSAAGASSACR